jgi:hypothetical protein
MFLSGASKEGQHVQQLSNGVIQQSAVWHCSSKVIALLAHDGNHTTG